MQLPEEQVVSGGAAIKSELGSMKSEASSNLILADKRV